MQFFTPSTLGNFLSDTLGGGADLTTATDVAEQREINSRALDIRNPDEERILSIYGAARLGANASFEGQLQLLAILNIFIGVFNLLPLPPLDGGHVAIGTYERLRSMGGRKHEVVGRARSDMLTHQLIDFLMGENDGVPKDPNYIFRLYMALGNYPQAAKTAIIIARQEQELGNYRVAHGILYETHRELTAQRIRVRVA